ncbi:MAG: hypothetical protein ACK4ZE_00115 [Sphingorhabdus sp.]
MKKQQVNPVLHQDSYSNWNVRTSMLAMLAAAAPAAAHAGTEASTAVPEASAFVSNATQPKITFVRGTGVQLQQSSSGVAIAAATASPSEASVVTGAADHRNIIFVPGTGLPGPATGPTAQMTSTSNVVGALPVAGPRNDAVQTAPINHASQPQPTVPGVAKANHVTENFALVEKSGYGSHTDGPAAQNSDGFDISFRADTLVVTPVLNVGLVESERTAAAGETISFMGYSNYPAFIEKAEVRIFRATQSPDSEPVKVLAVNGDGVVQWSVPENAPSAMFYIYRVYGRGGKFDETAPQELTIVEQTLARKKAGERVSRPNFGLIDEAARRNIELNGLMATVTGIANPVSDLVRVSGQFVPISENGTFVSQQIVPRADAGMEVTVDRGGKQIKRVAQSFAAPSDDWLVVGQGDLTLGKSYGSGSADVVSGDSLASGNYAIGRAAFYAKGVIDGDVRVTASVDTGETLLDDLFSNFDRKDPRQLLRRLNRDQYYPTYGDNSTLVEDAPTQGRFYLRVNKDDNQLVVGNFVTQVNGAELAQLDRGLFGALIDYNSQTTTSFGERKSQITAFASDPGTVPGREEFRGTGGSLYFLKRQDVSIGSERVRIEVRDRETGLVVESRDLHPQQDYDFDPLQGRIMLLKPLASTVASSSTVREGSSTGNVPVLVIRYEYSPPVGSLDGYTVGGRGTGWMSDKVRFGVTAQRDTVDEAAQTLIGADIMFRATAGTYIKTEIARTDGPGFGQSNSVDGGLSFTDIANPGTAVKARAYRAEAAVNFAELAGKSDDGGTASVYYERYDAGFASAGRLTPAETERYGAAIAIPMGDSAHIAVKYEQLTSGASGKSKTGTIDLSQRFGEITAKAGVRYEDRTPGLLYNSIQDGSRTDAAVELAFAPTGQDFTLQAFGQTTLDRDAGRSGNNRIGVGAKAELSEKMSLAAEVSDGDGGVGADVQVNSRLGNGTEAYVGYALFADRTDTGLDSQNIFTRSNRGTLTVGARQRFADSLSIYGENRTGFGGNAPSLTRSFGMKFDPTEKLSFTGSFENGRIDDATTGIFRRTAGSVGVGYSNDVVRIGSSVELRKEKGVGRDQTVWLLRNDFSYSVTPDWTALARFNTAKADNESTSIRAAEFTEAMGGLAFRPVDNERLNALLRFSYFEDLGPVGQVTGSGQVESPKQISKIASIDVNYDINEWLTVGGKYGYRGGKVSLDRNSDVFVKSDAHLAVIRADFHVNKRWDVMAEGRGLWVTAADDKRFGALGAIYRHLGNNVKVGVGYSLSDFSDDLTDQSYTSHGPFLNVLGKF